MSILGHTPKIDIEMFIRKANYPMKYKSCILSLIFLLCTSCSHKIIDDTFTNRVIYINGTSSSGKTTLAETIQEYSG